MTSLILMASMAFAADNEISFEVGSIRSDDSSWDAFSSDNALPTRGIRVGFGVADHVAILASFHHAAQGADVDLNSSNTDNGYFGTAFYGNSLGVGAKFDFFDNTYLRPYIAPQLIGQHAIARLDEDPDDDNNVNQISATGMAFGGMANAGVDLVLSYDSWKVAPSSYLELGYGWMSQLQLDDLGDVQFKGLTVRFGVGLHF